MSSEKYGFVYLWFDRKHKRFYIGSHWGTENDGYICSSTWMRNAYKRRPEDFKRRVICRLTSRVETYDAEHAHLCRIRESELGTRYYNLTNHKNGHWSTGEQKLKSTKEKLKDAWVRRKERGWKFSDESRAALSESAKARAVRPPSWAGKKHSSDTCSKISSARKGKPTRHGPHSEATKEKIRNALLNRNKA